MTGFADRTTRHARLIGVAFPVLLAALLWLSGVPLLASLRAVAGVLWIVLVPGLALACGLSLGRTPGDRLGLGAALGAALIGPLWCISTALCAPGLDPLLPLLLWPLPFAVWLFRSLRSNTAERALAIAPDVLAALPVVLLFLALVYLPAYQESASAGIQLCMRKPLLAGSASVLHVGMAARFGVDASLEFPFVAEQPATLIHLQHYAVMALLGRLGGVNPLVVEFRLFPLLGALLGLLALRPLLAESLVRNRPGALPLLVALLGSPLLVLLYGVLPQLLLAWTALAAGLALAFSGRSSGRLAELVPAGLLLGSIAQIDLHWAVVVLPGVVIAALWPTAEHPGRSGRLLAASTVLGAAAVTGLALLVLELGSITNPLALAPGSLPGLVAERLGQALRVRPGLTAAGVAAGLAVCGVVPVLAIAGWRRLPGLARRLLAGPALLGVAAALLLDFPDMHPITAFFAGPAALSLALLTATGVGAPATESRRLPVLLAGALLVASAPLFAGALLGMPCQEQVRLPSEEVCALQQLDRDTDPLATIAALDRPPAQAMLWSGLVQRSASGMLVDELFVPRIEPVFRMGPITARAERVQAILAALPSAARPALVDAALTELNAAVVELPAGAPLSAPLRARLEPLVQTAGSAYYRVRDAAAPSRGSE